MINNLQQIDGTITTLEIKREALEDASSAKGAVINPSKGFNKDNADINLDEVYGMMDAFAVVATLFSEAISIPLTIGNMINDDELEAELAALGEEMELEERIGHEEHLYSQKCSKASQSIYMRKTQIR